MRFSRVVKASDSRNCPGFDLSILRRSGIWGAANETVLNVVHKKSPCNVTPRVFRIPLLTVVLYIFKYFVPLLYKSVLYMRWCRNVPYISIKKEACECWKFLSRQVFNQKFLWRGPRLSLSSSTVRASATQTLPRQRASRPWSETSRRARSGYSGWDRPNTWRKLSTPYLAQTSGKRSTRSKLSLPNLAQTSGKRSTRSKHSSP